MKVGDIPQRGKVVHRFLLSFLPPPTSFGWDSSPFQSTRYGGGVRLILSGPPRIGLGTSRMKVYGGLHSGCKVMLGSDTQSNCGFASLGLISDDDDDNLLHLGLRFDDSSENCIPGELKGFATGT
ncbi:hypothetical protein M0R45_008231 [Rubus argutus]|uniref:Uncharacterized protein n=1 Tax=Rubus argutus TaxID=59490 RepID=A0AAW1Y1L9_RUBAR